ncbi:MAG: sulfotransferase [Luminiphilus sp.]|nr:sulfotransferase [Luminiphilus sp.]
MEINRQETLRLAIAAQESGKLQEAEHLYDLMLTANPNDVEVKIRRHSLLSYSHKTAGDAAPSNEVLEQLYHQYNAGSLKRAQRMARSLCKNFPNHPIAWKVLSAILLRRGDSLQAAEVSRKAVDLAPKDFEALHNLGAALAALGHLDEAEACYRAVMELQPSFSPTYNNLGIILKASGRFNEAKEIYRQAVALDPTCAAARSNLGNTLAALGDVSGARASLEHALKIKPDLAEVHRYLASVKKFHEKDKQYVAMYEQYQSLETSPDQRCHLSFGLAKASEDLGLLEEAFSYYSEGNSLRKEHLQYDSSQDRDLFASLKASHLGFSKVLHSVADESFSIMPIFIVGMPRSGSSLAEHIISSHSQVRGGGELTHVEKLGKPLATGEVEVTPDSIMEFRRKYLEEIAKIAEGKTVIIDKGSQNYLYLGLLHTAFPEARFVHVKRNASAVCWANFKQYFPANGFGYCYALDDVVAYHGLYEDLMSYWNELFPNAVYELDYEAITVDQEAETKKLIRHLGLQWEESCLRPEDNDRPVATASNLQIRGPVYAGSSANWRSFAPYIGDAFASL